MCLITLQKKPLKAEKDIIVYKEVDKQAEENIYESIYNDFIWELNKLYKTKLKKSKDLACYDNISMVYYISNHGNDELTSISEGFHSMNKSRCIREMKNIKDKIISFIECKIPKGSLYYKDATGLYASNQLIALKEVKLKDLI